MFRNKHRISRGLHPSGTPPDVSKARYMVFIPFPNNVSQVVPRILGVVQCSAHSVEVCRWRCFELK